jgi:hypothetical protein
MQYNEQRAHFLSIAVVTKERTKSATAHGRLDSQTDQATRYFVFHARNN